MTDQERDGFLAEARLGALAIGRQSKGPLVAPVWYRYQPGGPFQMCIGATSAKARRLRVEGRATLAVIDGGGVYRYVAVEGPVTLTALGSDTRASILAMSSRYLGEAGGRAYTESFMARLAQDSLHDGHGQEEVRVELFPERWRTEILG